jgi:hypothetical protein
MNKWIFAILAIALASCGTQRQIKKCQKCYELLPTAKTEIKDSTHITYDTSYHVIEVPADTSIQIIQIVCDSTGNATIKTSNTTQGNRSRLSTSLANNTLTIQATCNEFIDSIQTLNKTISKYRSETNTIFVPKLIEKELTWWQKFKIKWGGWAFLLIAIYGTYKGLKTYYKVNTPMGLILTLRRKLMR